MAESKPTNAPERISVIRGGEVICARRGDRAARPAPGPTGTGGAPPGGAAGDEARPSRRRADVLVVGDRVREIAEGLEVPAGARVIDASGCVVAPGLVDLHCHLREPGFEDAETVASGARAAALGGYTALVAMPNTEPAIDSAEMVGAVRELAGGACAEVVVAGAITLGRGGSRLAPLAELAGAGVRICTDDGAGVQDAELMRRALQYARPLGIVLAEHCEEASLAAGGLMHEGQWSERLGIQGMPAEAEEVMAARDIALARASGARLHLLHVSTAGTASMLAAARAAGVAVSGEVTPHHLTLTDAALAGFDPLFRVNPPLRSRSDVDALRAALLAGEIDAVATDHAPHPPETKERPLDEAPPGMIGLETALAVLVTELGVDVLELVLAAMSRRPAAIAGISGHQGELAPGRRANVVVVDPVAEWTVEPDRLASKSRNTPFAGWRLRGRVRHTLFEGEQVVRDAEALR